MKKLAMLLVSVFFLITLAGCAKYSSDYNAVGFVHNNDSNSAFMNFYTFDGCIVFKLKSSAEGDVHYTAKLESGSAAVYYDAFGEKEELFTISDGGEIDSQGGYIEAGTVYIIVETDGKCQNGEFHFSIGDEDAEQEG